MIENIALALERIEITIERVRDRQRMERERERANLLRTISHDLKGIGLGLTICETVVNAHGGTITGRNREDGQGAEFIFTLPL